MTMNSPAKLKFDFNQPKFLYICLERTPQREQKSLRLLRGLHLKMYGIEEIY